MVCRFLVVMPWGRVGSNLLMNLIGQAKVRKKLNSEKFNQLKTAEEQAFWFRDFYELDRQPEARLIGSKQNVLSMRDIEEIVRLARAEQMKVIRMRRDNFVKAAVSQMRAEEYAKRTLQETGVARWAVRRGETVLEALHLDTDLLLRRIEMMQREHDRMMRYFAPLPGIDVEYEEINGDLPNVFDRVITYLEVPCPVREPPFLKATPDYLPQAIANYDEVVLRLNDTPYYRYLTPRPNAEPAVKHD